jgi:two-component sensor histidine kinase
VARLVKAFGRRRGSRLHGIRFRLGLAMAVALLPILILGAFQANRAFEAQDVDQRADLQLAVERTSAAAKARLDSTSVLLQALRPEALELFCRPRLTSLVQRLDDIDGLARLSVTGQPTCASDNLTEAPPAWLSQAAGSAWFQRLRAGEDTIVVRAPDAPGVVPSLIVAIRLERPMGAFNGVMLASVPLSRLQPDINDPALPEGSQAALTDAAGRLLTVTERDAFLLRNGSELDGWVDQDRGQGSTIFEGRDSRGRPRVYAGTAVAEGNVYALLSAPAPDLLSWARLNPLGAFFAPVLAWLLALMCVTWVSERIVVRWLVYLERVAALYAKGKFSVRPTQAVHAPAEIRNLASTLNDLADTISARNRSLTASLEEKDALMREIHHRVKNNLQIISSLLSMQQRALTDAPAKAAVGDTRQRIAALALIYRTLYQSDDLRYADARVFLTDLVGQLVAGDAGRGPVVTSSVEADSLVVDPDKLAPLALWLVEAVSNAQKHAFAGRGGDLKVRFKVDGDTSVLEVEDDGPGVSETERAGVGRTLMGAFAKQLRGTAEMVPSPSGGTLARMTFATPEAVTPIDPSDLGTSAAQRH